MKNNSTAILVFTRSAGEEAENKVFEPTAGHSGNVKIAEKLIAHTCKMARQSKAEADVHIINSDRQRGDTFGERLANAFESLYQVGYQKVIAIGNDSPWVEGNLLRATVENFKNRDAVLGPASDGGAYLIGIDRDAFNRTAFINLAWNSDHLYQDLTNYLKTSHFTYTELPELSDIDSVSDFRSFLQKKSPNYLLRQFIKDLQSIIAGFQIHQTFYYCYFFSLQQSKTIQLRAPPLTSAA